MGKQLKELYAQAKAKGGVALTAKLAIKTSINSVIADSLEDSPDNLDKVTRALDELLVEAGNAGPAPTPQRAGPGHKKSTRLQKYYDYARDKGGVPLVVKLAMKTCITSAIVDELPDTPENIDKVRKALTELLPGVTIPSY